ncbi:hypothetical protein SPRG_19002 [Saprolegnia parasitica CBS 223.65]|uniref:FYVE-type domain-containing protein n=1 Tax=Saprolegnia parasitica (strain CBS 223.65) TaxID=695850 RepID=A0A067D638_SAPPC|nr:hypothetical protein SPRG_19002 [Saprolegnia parasitica CBS 223.65]KDO34146.1 hypothetical protein SPRG_19002 [Saprolegnia parasitica CBS 223.65]|eukprot:XP_012195201.1 hypothetical protein SPRG_19002 [Saprolegnia parasitica CBS 223.65]
MNKAEAMRVNSRSTEVLTMDQLKPQEEWVQDAERHRCHVCTRNFHNFRRKHHCRVCGEVVCGNCLLKKIADLPVKGKTEVKVCMSCILNQAGGGGNPQAPPNARMDNGPDSRYSAKTVDASPSMAKNSESTYRSSPPGSFVEQRSYGSAYDPSAEYNYPLDFSWGYPWPKPPVLQGEDERLAAVRSFDILDTPPEDVFDIICDLASNALKCPIAVVALMDKDRQWFKASVGLAQTEIPRNVSFCAHTIISKEPMVVLDTLQDKRFAKNPLVTGAASIRFYAGSPIITPSGQILGTVFVFDNQPRHTCDLATLEKLSNVAMKNLEDRKNAVAAPLSSGLPPAPTAVVVNESDAAAIVPAGFAKAAQESQDLVVQNAGDGQVVAGPKMETMLMDLLCRTTETQQQLATQQGAMFQTLGQHTAQIDKLADAVKRMEAKLDAREAE